MLIFLNLGLIFVAFLTNLTLKKYIRIRSVSLLKLSEYKKKICALDYCCLLWKDLFFKLFCVGKWRIISQAYWCNYSLLICDYVSFKDRAYCCHTCSDFMQKRSRWCDYFAVFDLRSVAIFSDFVVGKYRQCWGFICCVFFGGGTTPN